MHDLIGSIKLVFQTKNFFCRVFVILWGLFCAFMTLVFILATAGSVGVADIFLILLFYFFAYSAFLIPAISIAQGEKAGMNINHYTVSDKTWGLTLVLSFFLGYLGIHRFYVGRKTTGIVYIFTMGGFIFGWLTDIILILTGNFTDGDGKVIKRETRSSAQNNQFVDAQRKQLLVRRHQAEDKVIFTEIIVPGTTEKSQAIPPESVTEAGSNSTLPIEKPMFGKEDVFNFDFDNAFSRYSSNGKFIKDMQKYKDNIGRRAPFVPFMQYWPTYDSMNQSQRAWYFYWRGEVRNGHYPDTDLSYIFVHMYEILSGCGWDIASDGYAQLITLWSAYRDRFPELDNYLFDWSCDFAQLHNLDYVVPVGTDLRLPSQPVLCDLLIDRHREDKPLKLSFALINVLCDYSIMNSKFYKDGNQLLMNEAVTRVVSLADAALLKKKGKGVLELYGPNRIMKQSYYAFRGAVCPYANKRVIISVRAYTSSQKLRNYMNELVRYAENVLREINGYRGRLRGINLDSETATLVSNFLKKEYSVKKEIPIPQKKVEINLDLSAIETLRAESDAVRVALEVVDQTVSTTQFLADLDEVENGLKTTPNIDDQPLEEDDATIQASTYAYFDVTHLSEKMELAIEAMTTIQQKALWAIVVLDNPQKQLNALADEALTMPEILIDEINEIASQQLDDILVDTFNETLCILEQYEQELKNAVIAEVI